MSSVWRQDALSNSSDFWINVTGQEIQQCYHDNHFEAPPVGAPAALTGTQLRHPDWGLVPCIPEGFVRCSTTRWSRLLHPQTPSGTPRSLELEWLLQSASSCRACHCGSRRSEEWSDRGAPNTLCTRCDRHRQELADGPTSAVGRDPGPEQTWPNLLGRRRGMGLWKTVIACIIFRTQLAFFPNSYLIVGNLIKISSFPIGALQSVVFN